MTGLILLLLIGALIAFGWVRLRGRLKLPISGKQWVGPIVIVSIVLLMLFSKHQGH